MAWWPFKRRQSYASLFYQVYLLERTVIKIMATQAELASQVTALTNQVAKVGTEIATLQQRIADLEVIISTAPVSTELQAAFDALKAQVQVVDDANPDAPPPPP